MVPGLPRHSEPFHFHFDSEALDGLGYLSLSSSHQSTAFFQKPLKSEYFICIYVYLEVYAPTKRRASLANLSEVEKNALQGQMLEPIENEGCGS